MCTARLVNLLRNLAVMAAGLALLTGCAQPVPLTPTTSSATAAVAANPTNAPTPAPPTVTPPIIAPTGVPPTVAPPTVQPSATPQIGLPPEPRQVTLRTSDGRDLAGVYYPGAATPSPLVVLMHWAPGSIADWGAIAPWLQNRGMAATAWPGAGAAPKWRDPSWFPKLDAGRSYAVLTFSFTGCGDSGCTKFVPDQWLLDAQAVMATAWTLEGVDPERIVAVGASIGADGALDGCLWLNEQHPGACQGAMSLSPGGYLKLPYEDAASRLQAAQPGVPAWCLYATGDAESQRACTAAEGAQVANLHVVKYDGNAHGMNLVNPTTSPEVLGLLIEFLGGTLGGA